MTTTTNFQRALNWILPIEGGFVDNPKDPGGRTNHGITQRTYDYYRKTHQSPLQDVKLIALVEVSAIYATMFWTPSYADHFDYMLAIVLFDTYVQFNPQTFWYFVHQACGESTSSDVVKLLDLMYRNERQVASSIVNMRIAYRYQRVKQDPSQKQFLAGWINRDNKLAKESNTTIVGAHWMEPTVFDPHVIESFIDSVNSNPDKDIFLDFLKAFASVQGHSFDEADAIEKFFNKQFVPMVDVQKIIAIAKAACKVVSFLDTTVCPVVNGLG